MKYEAFSLVRLVQSQPIPTRVLEDISLDFIMGLLKTTNANTILAVVD